MADPRNARRAAVEAAAAARGITITRRGVAYKLTGPGVDLTVADLGIVDLRSLEPFAPRNDERG